MSISNYLEEELLDQIFNNLAAPAITTPYISLHPAECTGGSYIRKAVSFGAASGGAISSDAALTFPSMPACTVTHVGVWDAESSGNFLWGGALTASKVVNSGDTFEIASGDLDVTLD